MLHIETLVLGDLQTNCYLVNYGNSTVVIDPGDDVQTLARVLENKSVAGVLITHAHYDHILGLPALRGVPVYVHEADAPAMTDPVRACAPEEKSLTIPATHTVREGDVLSLGGMTFTVLHTPGHTPGSVCYACEDALFTGDTLFAHGYGRTDLPGGSFRALRESLRTLLHITQDVTLYPGHGESVPLRALRGQA